MKHPKSPSAFQRHLPNILTVSRVLVILPICLLITYEQSSAGYSIAMALTLFAVITDFFDGYLSRKWGVVSDFGRLLDPVADKLLVAALLILLCAEGYGNPLAVVAIMLREIFISGLREFMQEHNIIIHVSTLAKYKTTIQMVACVLLLTAGILKDIPTILTVANAILWLAVALTWITGIDYMKGAISNMRGKG